jgi:hypothetical protein
MVSHRYRLHGHHRGRPPRYRGVRPAQARRVGAPGAGATRVYIAEAVEAGRTVEGPTKPVEVRFTAEVANSSDEVINYVQVRFVARDWETEEPLKTVGETEFMHWRLPPSEKLTAGPVRVLVPWDDTGKGPVRHFVDMNLEFTDAAGIEWRRSEEHTLSEHFGRLPWWRRLIRRVRWG